jgi:hypothetical protein
MQKRQGGLSCRSLAQASMPASRVSATAISNPGISQNRFAHKGACVSSLTSTIDAATGCVSHGRIPAALRGIAGRRASTGGLPLSRINERIARFR